MVALAKSTQYHPPMFAVNVGVCDSGLHSKPSRRQWVPNAVRAQNRRGSALDKKPNLNRREQPTYSQSRGPKIFSDPPVAAKSATEAIWPLGNVGAGGGTRTRTELSLQRILSLFRVAEK